MTSNSKSADGASRRSNGELLAYAAPQFVMGAMTIPAAAMMPNIYAKHTAVTLAAIGAVLVFINLLDMFTDQAVGFLSDRTRGRLGARKPWLLAGMPIYLVGVWHFYIPPADAGIVYYTGWMLVVGLGATCMNIPYVSWGAELTGDYRERSRVFMFHSVFGQTGGLLLFAAPLMLFAADVLPSTEFGPEQVRYITYAGCILLPILVCFAVVKAPVGEAASTAKKPGIIELFHSIRGNRPFLRYIGIFFLAVIGHGAYATLIVMMGESYFGIGDKLPWIFIMMSVISIVAIYPWMAVVKRIGKHRSWAISWIASALILPCLALLPPGPESLPWILLIMGSQSLMESVSNFVAPSMLGDIIDYDTLKTGSDSAGNYFGFFNVMVKASATLGGGTAFIILGLFQYNVKQPELNGEWQQLGMIIAAMLLPAAIKMCCALLMWNFPIDERRHGIIRRRIDQREERQARADGRDLSASFE